MSTCSLLCMVHFNLNFNMQWSLSTSSASMFASFFMCSSFVNIRSIVLGASEPFVMWFLLHVESNTPLLTHFYGMPRIVAAENYPVLTTRLFAAKLAQANLMPLIIPVAPFFWYGLTFIPAWIRNYTHYKVWDESTYLFLNFNGATVEVYEWISNFIPHFAGKVITYIQAGIKVKPCQ